MLEHVVSELTARGLDVLYTPESVVASPAPALVRPHLRAVAAYGGSRVAGTPPASVGRGAARELCVLGLGLPWLLLGWLPGLILPGVLRVWAVSVAVYALLLVGVGVVAALKFRSVVVGLVTLPTLIATHVAYLVGLIRGRWTASRATPGRARLYDGKREPQRPQTRRPSTYSTSSPRMRRARRRAARAAARLAGSRSGRRCLR